MAGRYSQKKSRASDSIGGGTFAMLRHDLIQSKLWRNLSPRAVKVFCYLVSTYNGSNNGALSVSQRHAKELVGISNHPVNKGIQELLDCELLKITKRGGYGLGCHMYRLTCYATDEIAPSTKKPTDEWKINVKNTI